MQFQHLGVRGGIQNSSLSSAPQQVQASLSYMRPCLKKARKTVFAYNLYYIIIFYIIFYYIIFFFIF